MKRKKTIDGAGNVIDLKEIMDRKKINDLCDLDFGEFKSAVTRLLLSIVEAMGENNGRIDKSFKMLIEHLQAVSVELKFIKQVLYMERVLNGEYRDGPMTMEQKAALAKAFGIDFDKFVKQVTGKDKRKKIKKPETGPTRGR